MIVFSKPYRGLLMKRVHPYKCLLVNFSSINVGTFIPVRLASSSNNKLKRINHYFSNSILLTTISKYVPFKNLIVRFIGNPPLPTIIAFLILHEITAIIPLFTIWAMLYNLNICSTNYLSSFLSDKIKDLGEPLIERIVGHRGEHLDKQRLLITGAVSYVIIKLLYPVRIIASILGAPLVAKWLVIPFRTLRQRIISKPNGK